jgi:hypothetical protein
MVLIIRSNTKNHNEIKVKNADLLRLFKTNVDAEKFLISAEALAELEIESFYRFDNGNMVISNLNKVEFEKRNSTDHRFFEFYSKNLGKGISVKLFIKIEDFDFTISTKGLMNCFPGHFYVKKYRFKYSVRNGKGKEFKSHTQFKRFYSLLKNRQLFEKFIVDLEKKAMMKI